LIKLEKGGNDKREIIHRYKLPSQKASSF